MPRRIDYINVSTHRIHELVDELYESLVDEEWDQVMFRIEILKEVLDDINQTFRNDI
jgi:hypothetical protein